VHGSLDATYRVDIEGDPDIHCVMTLGEAEGSCGGTRRDGVHSDASG
jgi:hypothetical protein